MGRLVAPAKDVLLRMVGQDHGLGKPSANLSGLGGVARWMDPELLGRSLIPGPIIMGVAGGVVRVRIRVGSCG